MRVRLDVVLVILRVLKLSADPREYPHDEFTYNTSQNKDTKTVL